MIGSSIGSVAPAITVVAMLAAACAGSSTSEAAPMTSAVTAPVTAVVTTTRAAGEAPAVASAWAGPRREPRADPARRVVGYYAGWERATLAPDALPVGLLTHVIYAFAVVRPGGGCALADPTGERPAIAALQAWKQRSGAATLLAIGGWEGSQGFSEAAATAAGRDALASSCLGLARSLGFDGLDVDWEYPSGGKWPGRIGDPANHVALLEVLRARLAPGELLTVATPATPGALETFGLVRLAGLVDWFHVMAYDLAGAWDERTGHHAAPLSAPNAFSAESAIAAYEFAGVPPAQLVLGVPFYGRAFAGVDGVASPSGGLGEPFAGVPRTAPSGAITYRSLTRLVGTAGWERRVDPVAQAPVLVHARDRVLISYDDPTSLAAKTAFARAEGLGGMMVWELSGDDAAFTLLRAVNVGLGRPAG